MAKLVVVSTTLLLLFISLGDASCPVCSPYYHHPKHPPKSRPPKFKPPKPPVVGPKPPPIVQPPTRPVPPIVRPPPVVVPPPIISPPKRPPIVKPPFPPIVRPKPPLPPKHNKPCPPPPPPPYLPPPAPHPPPPATATCPIDTLRLGACVDLLGGLLHIIIGNRVRDTCCPVLQGLADLDAAVCLCTTIRLKLLNISLVLPIALELLIDCGKTPPPGYKCPV